MERKGYALVEIYLFIYLIHYLFKVDNTRLVYKYTNPNRLN